MDEVPGFNGAKPAETLRATALRGIEATQFYPGVGPGAPARHDRQPARLVLSRQRQWGVPMPFFLHKETGELHPRTLELLEQVAQRVEQGGIEAWQTLEPRGAARRRRRALREDQRHARRLVRLRLDASDRAARLARGDAGSHTRASSRPTSTSKAPTSIAAGSTRRCWCRAC